MSILRKSIFSNLNFLWISDDFIATNRLADILSLTVILEEVTYAKIPIKFSQKLFSEQVENDTRNFYSSI